MRLPPLVASAVASLVLVTGCLTGAEAAAAAPADAAIDPLIAQRLANPRLGKDVALLVTDAATGEVLSDHGADTLQLPASNMKLVTAVNTLAALGRDARLTTRVLAGAGPNDVILQGGGDPLLTTTELRTLAKLTAPQLTAGVPVVVHVDDDLFPAASRGPGWTTSYMPYVVAPVEALARLGDYSSDPSTNAAKAFTKKLTALGFTTTLGEPANADPAALVLAQSDGHSIDQAIHVMLSVSENNVAEVLYRQVALATGREASWDGARDAAAEMMSKLGIDPTGMALLDGSGVSRKDRLSPRFLSNVLRTARISNPEPFTTMFDDDALPVSGQTGTLAAAYGRFVTRNSRCAQGTVRAKTGTLFDTVALSGVAGTADGTERIFSILVNHRPQRYSKLSTRQAVDGLTATVTGCWS